MLLLINEVEFKLFLFTLQSQGYDTIECFLLHGYPNQFLEQQQQQQSSPLTFLQLRWSTKVHMLVFENIFWPSQLLNTLEAPSTCLNKLIVRTGFLTTSMSKFLELKIRHALYA